MLAGENFVLRYFKSIYVFKLLLIPLLASSLRPLIVLNCVQHLQYIFRCLVKTLVFGPFFIALASSCAPAGVCAICSENDMDVHMLFSSSLCVIIMTISRRSRLGLLWRFKKIRSDSQ